MMLPLFVSKDDIVILTEKLVFWLIRLLSAVMEMFVMVLVVDM